VVGEEEKMRTFSRRATTKGKQTHFPRFLKVNRQYYVTILPYGWISVRKIFSEIETAMYLADLRLEQSMRSQRRTTGQVETRLKVL
jgi:hypothetical protein